MKLVALRGLSQNSKLVKRKVHVYKVEPSGIDLIGTPVCGLVNPRVIVKNEIAKINRYPMYPTCEKCENYVAEENAVVRAARAQLTEEEEARRAVVREERRKARELERAEAVESIGELDPSVFKLSEG